MEPRLADFGLVPFRTTSSFIWRSEDQGHTYPVNAFATAVDRQWFGFYKNPASTGALITTATQTTGPSLLAGHTRSLGL